jgi:hypothetical protein
MDTIFDAETLLCKARSGHARAYRSTPLVVVHWTDYSVKRMPSIELRVVSETPHICVGKVVRHGTAG